MFGDGLVQLANQACSLASKLVSGVIPGVNNGFKFFQPQLFFPGRRQAFLDVADQVICNALAL